MGPAWRRTLAVGVLGLAAALAQAKEPERVSAWMAPAEEGGAPKDRWAGRLLPLDDLPLLVGVQNDARYVYVCVRTSDPVIKREFARRGLTVWANGAGKDRRGYGVRFPVRGEFAGPGREPGAAGGPPAEARSAPEGNGPAQDMELIGPTEDDRLVVPAAGAGPVAASVRDDFGVMVLELRLPLAPDDDHPLAIGARPGSTIALGLETESRAGGGRSGWRGRDGGGEGRGGEGADEEGEGRGGFGGAGRGGFGGPARGGFGGGGWGGGRGSEAGRGPGEASPIKAWLRVALAGPPAAPGR